MAKFLHRHKIAKGKHLGRGKFKGMVPVLPDIALTPEIVQQAFVVRNFKAICSIDVYALEECLIIRGKNFIKFPWHKLVCDNNDIHGALMIPHHPRLIAIVGNFKPNKSRDLICLKMRGQNEVNAICAAIDAKHKICQFNLNQEPFNGDNTLQSQSADANKFTETEHDIKSPLIEGPSTLSRRLVQTPTIFQSANIERKHHNFHKSSASYSSISRNTSKSSSGSLDSMIEELCGVHNILCTEKGETTISAARVVSRLVNSAVPSTLVNCEETTDNFVGDEDVNGKTIASSNEVTDEKYSKEEACNSCFENSTTNSQTSMELSSTRRKLMPKFIDGNKKSDDDKSVFGNADEDFANSENCFPFSGTERIKRKLYNDARDKNWAGDVKIIESVGPSACRFAPDGNVIVFAMHQPVPSNYYERNSVSSDVDSFQKCYQNFDTAKKTNTVSRIYFEEFKCSSMKKIPNVDAPSFNSSEATQVKIAQHAN